MVPYVSIYTCMHVIIYIYVYVDFDNSLKFACSGELHTLYTVVVPLVYIPFVPAHFARPVSCCIPSSIS